LSNRTKVGHNDQILKKPQVLESERRFIRQIDDFVINASGKHELDLIKQIDKQAQSLGTTIYDVFGSMQANQIKSIFPKFKIKKS